MIFRDRIGLSPQYQENSNLAVFATGDTAQFQTLLEDFNPCFVLDLTATPKKESNIISYMDAVQLKNEHMVTTSTIPWRISSRA